MDPAQTVFVLDDDPSMLKALERLLKAAGHKAQLFDSPEAFLQEDLPTHPACLILDVRLPGLSGLELQQKLDHLGRDLPIVFITGHGDIPMSVEAMKAGAVDFIPKPFDDIDLLRAVSVALERDSANLEERLERSKLRARLRTLTPREREVLEWVITGMLNKQIAYELGASEQTIKVHRGRVMRKMKADSLPDLVRLAQKVGIHGPSV